MQRCRVGLLWTFWIVQLSFDGYFCFKNDIYCIILHGFLGFLPYLFFSWPWNYHSCFLRRHCKIPLFSFFLLLNNCATLQCNNFLIHSKPLHSPLLFLLIAFHSHWRSTPNAFGPSTAPISSVSGSICTIWWLRTRICCLERPTRSCNSPRLA